MVHLVTWDFHLETNWKGRAYPGVSGVSQGKVTVLNQEGVYRMGYEYRLEPGYQAYFQLDFAVGKSYCHCCQKIEPAGYHLEIDLGRCMAYLRAVRSLEAAGCPPHIPLDLEMAGCTLQEQHYMAYLRAMRSLVMAGWQLHILLEFEMAGCMLQVQHCTAYLPATKILAVADCLPLVQGDS
jgi:hypothetical protein